MSAKWSTLFDPDQARGPRPGPDVGGGNEPSDGGEGGGPLTVSVLLARIKGALADAFPRSLSVVGEISDFKRHTSGHLYFRLKDEGAAIDAVMFRGSAGKLKFEPTDGLEVVATGRVDVYEVRGQLQLYVTRMTPRGEGALELALRQLREKLEGEGLFDLARKKPLPRFPRAIGVVTSPTGAAIRDIRRTLLRRWPGVRVYLFPTLVQGEGAAEQIAEAVALLDAEAERLEIDTLLVGRGGGSLEDLWAFNEEIVARAIFAARTPIISGVGHEVDVTISDLVADVRAATPTAAAELAVPDAREVRQGLADLSARIGRAIQEDVTAARAALTGLLRSAVFRDPTVRIRTQTQRIDELSHRMHSAAREQVHRGLRRVEPAAGRLATLHPARLAERAGAKVDRLLADLRWALGGCTKRGGDALARLEKCLAGAHPLPRVRLARQRIGAARRQLDALSYRGVLKRGFSVTRGPDGAILRSSAPVTGGDRIETELADGRFRSIVDRATASPPKRKPRTDRDAGQPTLFDETQEED